MNRMRIYFNPEDTNQKIITPAYSYDVPEDEERKTLEIPESWKLTNIEDKERIDTYMRGDKKIDIMDAETGEVSICDDPAAIAEKRKQTILSLLRKKQSISENIDLLEGFGENADDERIKLTEIETELSNFNPA